MARAAALSIETLTALGAEPLARLVLDGTRRDPAFKRIVSAALAATKGPQAVAALVDKRLAGLERARGFVDWEKVKTFAADVDATVTTIVDQIGPADPALAIAALLRFLNTTDAVLERVDDGQGRVQAVYDTAADAIAPLAARLPERDRASLPERIMAIGPGMMSYMPRLIKSIGPHLDNATLAAWDNKLAASAGPPGKGRAVEYHAMVRQHQVLTARQMIAVVRKDIDALAALESAKPSHTQNHLRLAELYLEVGRPNDALMWVRKPSGSTIRYMRMADVSDHARPLDHNRLQRARLEADILDALGDPIAAQEVRWSSFAETLDPDILRAYMGHLGEFEEFDALDRAFALVEAADTIHGALTFLIDWPRLDKAAALVIRHRDKWDGASYDMLGPAAELLEPDHPAAAALIYRRLLDSILAKSRSNAYGHGATYLARLDALAPDLDRAALPDLSSHADYRAGLAKAHGRKSGFWARVKAR